MSIPEASELACIIEAGTFKPGNIYPGREGFIDLVVSAVLLRRSIEKILNSSEGHLGMFIKEAVADRVTYIPANTNFGIILLFVPLAVAASKGRELQKTVNELVHQTTKEDAVHFAEAAQFSGTFLGEPPKGPDLRFDKGMSSIRAKNMTLLDLFVTSSAWDTIASEWISGFPITFSGAQFLIEGGAIIELYLKILSEYPDSLVLRRFGKKMARNVSERAGKLLKDFSLKILKEWDNFLFKKGINPGTTADIVASSVFVALLEREDILERLLHEIPDIQK
ncbi:MAG: hypothetical protein AYK18_03320 [Theionarchaea archaeon DG-70]|nr:MAG: hypothetical protein AYK18_03320 [Theionarchaea archaeon DG-70]